MSLLEILDFDTPLLGHFVHGILQQSRLRHIPLLELFDGLHEELVDSASFLTCDQISILEGNWVSRFLSSGK